MLSVLEQTVQDQPSVVNTLATKGSSHSALWQGLGAEDGWSWGGKGSVALSCKYIEVQYSVRSPYLSGCAWVH